MHVPSEVPTSQASQDPLQALLQQTPSAQKSPAAHSGVLWQLCPCLLLHAPVESQVPGQVKNRMASARGAAQGFADELGSRPP